MTPPPASAEAWTELPPAERQVQAGALLTALRGPELSSPELEALDALVEAHTHLFSNAGLPSTHTLKAYRAGARELAQWCAQDGGRPLATLSADDALRYRAWLSTRPSRRGRPLSPATCELRLVAARALMTALEWTGVRSGQPFARVRAPKSATAAVVNRPPYNDLVLGVIANLKNSEEDENRRLWTLCLLCLHAGLRINEALELRRHQVSGGAARLYGKGGKLRVVPLSAQLVAALDALPLVGPRAEGRYFCWTYATVHARMFKLFREAGCGEQWRGFHPIRKACATRLYRKTQDFTRVSLFLGHASADTTRRYVAVGDQDVATEVSDWRD